MEVPSVIVAFVLIVSLALGWWMLLAGLTGKSRADFRTELWKLRDEIMDDLVIPHPKPTKGASDMLEAVESCIRQSEQFTLFRVMSMYLIWKSMGSPMPARKLDLTPRDEHDEMKIYKQRLNRICTKFLVTNSLFGFLTLLLPVVAFLAKLPQWLRGGRVGTATMDSPSTVAQRPIRVDVQADAWANRSTEDVKKLLVCT